MPLVTTVYSSAEAFNDIYRSVEPKLQMKIVSLDTDVRTNHLMEVSICANVPLGS